MKSIKSMSIKKIGFFAAIIIIAGALAAMYFFDKSNSPVKKIDIQKPIATPLLVNPQDEDSKGDNLTTEGQAKVDASPGNNESISKAPALSRDTTQIMEALNAISLSLVDLSAKIEALDKTVKELKDEAQKMKLSQRVTPKNRAGVAIPNNNKAFDIVGVDIKSLAIVANKQSKIIVIGEELPNGAIFQGFDGKSVLTSKGPIRINDAIAN